MEGEQVTVNAQPWGSTAPTEQAVLATYTLAAERAEQGKPRLEALLKRASSGQAKIIVGIKSFESFLDKAIARGRGTDQIFDMLRGAVLTDSDAEAVKVVHALRRITKFTRIEYKDKGSDPTFGYFGSYHINIVLDGMICEVQIMTRRLWTYKAWGHEFYQQFRSNPSAPDPAVLRQSRNVFALGNMKRFKSSKPSQN